MGVSVTDNNRSLSLTFFRDDAQLTEDSSGDSVGVVARGNKRNHSLTLDRVGVQLNEEARRDSQRVIALGNTRNHSLTLERVGGQLNGEYWKAYPDTRACWGSAERSGAPRLAAGDSAG